MTKKNELKIRDLNTGDVFTVAKMLLKVVGENKDSIKKLIKSKPGDSKKKKPSQEEQEELGIDLTILVLQNCFEFAENDLKEWFADLVGVDPKDFDKTGFDTIPLIINELTERKDVHNFFTTAFQLFKKMSKSHNRLATK